MDKKPVRIGKKGASRRLAQMLKELRERPIPDEILEALKKTKKSKRS